jgi:hypothetical protein
MYASDREMTPDHTGEAMQATPTPQFAMQISNIFA